MDLMIVAGEQQAGPVRPIRCGLLALTATATLLATVMTPISSASADLAPVRSEGVALGSVERNSDGQCPQPVRQQTVPAPTELPWNAVRLGLDHVAGLSQGAGQLVAVLDTGVDAVPALAGAVRPGIDLAPVATNPSTVGRTSAAQATDGQSPVNPSSGTSDCDGRGTVLAGLIAAGRGVGEVLPGLARAAGILPVRVTATAGELPEPQVLAEAIDAAVAGGATVVLVAGTVRADPALQAATEAALAAGVPVVAAAGDGTDQTLGFPASYDGVIAVAATGPKDDPQPVNAVGHVTVGAPGVDLVGLGLDGGFVGGQSGSAPAAAAVAATVADLRARFPELTPAQLRDRIAATADRPGVAVPDPTIGWGVLNPVTALTAPVQPAATAVVSTAAAAALPVLLPPEPPNNNWAVVVAGIMLVLAAAVAAVVSGVRRASARRWRPAAPDAVHVTVSTDSAPEFTGDFSTNPDEIAALRSANSQQARQLAAGPGQGQN